MIPVNSFKGIEESEKQYDNDHIIIFLLVKPSDDYSENIISKFNYFHYKSGNYCNIYPIGYSEHFTRKYSDVVDVIGVDNKVWEYSDNCFIEFLEDISRRLPSWKYSEDIQVVILQSDVKNEKTKLDFKNYYSLDISYGIRKGYIESFAKFMGYLIDACKYEIESKKALKRTNKYKISKQKILEYAIDSVPKLPISIKHMLLCQ